MYFYIVTLFIIYRLIRMTMKKSTFILFLICLQLNCFGQKTDWIPFRWVGDSVSGKFIDKYGINIPVSIQGLPHKFNMQFDLGAETTTIYGNNISEYLQKYPDFSKKIDTNLVFFIQSKKNPMFNNVGLNLGNISFGKRNIGYFREYGDKILLDSIKTKSEKHIGTIAPDLFKDKFLIIDYPNQRILVTEKLKGKFTKSKLLPCSIVNGRIKIPLIINGKSENLMFDTGSSIFSLISSEDNAKKISTNEISDSLSINSWGKKEMVYGRKINVKIKFNEVTLKPSNVYFFRNKMFSDFFKQQNIWGITGNQYFLNSIVIIDYKNNRFGIISNDK